MKKFGIVGIAIASMVTASSAIAADLPLRPAYKAAPAEAVFNWTGFYVGAHVGWLSATSSITDEGYYDSGATTTLKTVSFAGGGQIGYNLQVGSAVYGIEVDASWANAEKSYLGYYAIYSTKWNSFGTIRGRLGLDFNRTLAYVTAGVAWADFHTIYNTDISSGGQDGQVSSKNKWGLVAGVGVEHAITNAWTVKLETLYMRFDTTSEALPRTTCSTNSGPSHACTFDFDHEAWTVMLGFNYRLGNFGFGGPVMASY